MTYIHSFELFCTFEPFSNCDAIPVLILRDSYYPDNNIENDQVLYPLNEVPMILVGTRIKEDKKSNQKFLVSVFPDR